MSTLATLVRATRNAYGELVAAYEAAAGEPDHEATVMPIYHRLTAIYAEHGLDENVAESSVDWCEGGTLVESVQYELERKERA